MASTIITIPGILSSVESIFNQSLSFQQFNELWTLMESYRVQEVERVIDKMYKEKENGNRSENGQQKEIKDQRHC